MESQLVSYRQEKSRLEATLEVERAKLDTAEDIRSRLACHTLLVHAVVIQLDRCPLGGVGGWNEISLPLG